MNEQSAAGKVRARLQSGKLFEILAVVALVAVVAVILVATFTDEKTAVNRENSEYAAALESRLASVLAKMHGAGEVSVFITISSEGEKVVATESVTDKNGNVTEKPVLSGGEVIVLEEKKPEITGVLIVADGADDLNVRFSLLEAAASVLNIDQSKVKVYTGEGGK